MREKRKFIRFDIAVKVNYTVQKDSKIEKTGITKNMSAGGMQLLTEEKLETGNRVELKIFIPEALNPVHLNGIVLWTKELSTPKGFSYSAGIDFGTVEEDNKNTFLKFLCDLMYERVKK